jgi:hypothetical protein
MARRLVAGAEHAKREGDPREPRARTAVKAEMNINTSANPAQQSATSTLAKRGRAAGLGRWLAAGALVALLAVSSGCVAVVAGAGAGAAVAYVRGDLDATLSVSYEKTVRAANAALGDLQFVKVSEKKDALQAILVARNAADKKIEIRVEQISERAAKVKIRVGVFGDQALSLAILEKVKANL